MPQAQRSLEPFCVFLRQCVAFSWALSQPLLDSKYPFISSWTRPYVPTSASCLLSYDSSRGPPDDAYILSTLIEAYEREHYPIELPDPVEAIKFRLEQQGKDSH